jgi:hypothetical protein
MAGVERHREQNTFSDCRDGSDKTNNGECEMTARKKKTWRELIEVNFPQYKKLEDIPEAQLKNFLHAHVMSMVLREEMGDG